MGEFYLSELLEEIRSYYGEKMRSLRIDFSVESYPDCLLAGDQNRSVEVLQNVMENAVKYGDGHWIRVKCSEEEDCMLIAVSNSGNTLKDHEMPHIFDSFWRGSNAGGKTGSGLGLFICRQLMHRTNGEISAEAGGGETTVTAVFEKAGF